jgi:amidase
MTLTQFYSLLRARQISPRELIDRTIGHVEQHDVILNAFVLTYPREAREAAARSEQRFMDGTAGPLEGLPVTIKDSLDVAGSPTCCGSRLFADRTAAHDAASTRFLRESGAIIIGKTNCPEFLMNYESDNHLIGRTNNPWNLSRTAGGSSGGESAAIASGMSAGGMGSDGGGSIRWPAHACGIAGLKPTSGRVSAAGHVPEISHPGGLLGVVGPMARTVEDVRLLFSVLARYDPADPFSTPLEQRPVDLAPFRSGSLRIGLMNGWYETPAQAAIVDAVQKAGRALESIGFSVDEFRPRGLERAPDLWWFFFTQLFARWFLSTVEDRRDQLHWSGVELYNQALAEEEPTIPSLLTNFVLRDKMRVSLLQQMETHRVLVLPAAGVTAFPHRTRHWPTPKGEIGLRQAMEPLTPFNLFGMPGLVVPFGFDAEGLPCGVQLVGRPYDEELLLEIGVALEEARGPFPGPRGYEMAF